MTSVQKNWYELLVQNCRAAIAHAEQFRFFILVNDYLKHDAHTNEYGFDRLEELKNNISRLQSRWSELMRFQQNNQISFENYFDAIEKLNGDLLGYLNKLAPENSNFSGQNDQIDSNIKINWFFKGNIVSRLTFPKDVAKSCFKTLVDSINIGFQICKRKQLDPSEEVEDEDINTLPRNLRVGEKEEQSHDPNYDPLEFEQLMIWPDAAMFEKKNDDELIVSEAFVKIFEPSGQIMIFTTGEEREKRNLMKSLIDAFRSVAKEVEVEFICTCELCLRAGESSAQPFSERDLSELHLRFKRTIQCHKSGNDLRLDEISYFEQPKLKIVILYHEKKDNRYFEEFKKRLGRPLNYTLDIWDQSLILPGAYDDQAIIQENIDQADMIYMMFSTDFVTDIYTMDQSFAALNRQNRGNIWVGGILLKKCDWKERYPTSKEDIKMLNDSPIGVEPDNNDLWYNVIESFYEENKKWLDKLPKTRYA